MRVGVCDLRQKLASERILVPRQISRSQEIINLLLLLVGLIAKETLAELDICQRLCSSQSTHLRSGPFVPLVRPCLNPEDFRNDHQAALLSHYHQLDLAASQPETKMSGMIDPEIFEHLKAKIDEDTQAKDELTQIVQKLERDVAYTQGLLSRVHSTPRASCMSLSLITSRSYTCDLIMTPHGRSGLPGAG